MEEMEIGLSVVYGLTIDPEGAKERFFESRRDAERFCWWCYSEGFDDITFYIHDCQAAFKCRGVAGPGKPVFRKAGYCSA